MTAKQFFKSTSFKCIITLLCVLLISGIFLTIMNGLLAVSDQEKFDRAISKIYGSAVETDPVPIETNEVGSATINSAYIVKNDGNYLINSTGKEGFDNGTVTCWVVVKVSGDSNKTVSGIYKVTIESNKGQSYIDRVTDKALNQFSELYNGNDFTPDLITAATVNGTKNAICNAVNGALKFVREQVLKETAKSNPYDGFEYIDRINVTNAKSYFESGENGSVIFHILTKSSGDAGAFTLDITVNSEKAVESYVIVKNGSTEGEHGDNYADKMYAVSNYVGWKLDNFLAAMNANQTAINKDNAELDTGASYSNYLCIYAGAFATANYQNALDKLNEGGKTND